MLWCSHDTEWQVYQDNSVSVETANRFEIQSLPPGFLDVLKALKCTYLLFRNFSIFTAPFFVENDLGASKT